MQNPKNNSEFPKRLVFRTPLTTASGEDAEQYSQVEGLEKPQQISPEVNIDDLIKEADRFLELSEEEFLEKYGPVMATGETSIQAKIRLSQETDDKINALIDAGVQTQIESLRRKRGPHVETTGPDKSIIEEAQEFYESAIGGYLGEEDRKQFLENAKAFGLRMEDVPGGWFSRGEKGLKSKGELFRDLKNKEREHKRKQTQLNVEKRRLEAIQDDRKQIAEDYKNWNRVTWKLFKLAGIGAAGAAALATAPVGLPAIAGLGALNMLGWVPQGWTGSRYLGNSIRGSWQKRWNIKGAQNKEEQAKFSLTKVKNEMTRWDKNDEEKKARLQEDLNDLKQKVKDTIEEMQHEREKLRGFAPTDAEYPVSMTRIGELDGKKQVLENAVSHHEKLISLYDLALSHKNLLTDSRSLDALLQRKYFPATGEKVKKLLAKESKRTKESQGLIAPLRPTELMTSLSNLRADRIPALRSFITTLPATPQESTTLTGIDFLKKDHRPLYNLCVQLSKLPEDNPFRKKTKQDLLDMLTDSQTNIANLRTEIGTKTTAFPLHFKYEYVHQPGFFQNKGLQHLIELVLGEESSLGTLLDKSFTTPVLFNGAVRGTAAGTVAFSEKQLQDLQKVLRAIEGDPPQYRVYADGRVEAYAVSQTALQEEVTRSYGALDTPMKEYLRMNWQNLSAVQTAVLPATSPAVNLPAPTGTEGSFDRYRGTLKFSESQTLKSFLDFMKTNMVLDSGNLIVEVDKAKDDLKNKIDSLDFSRGGLYHADKLIVADPSELARALQLLQKENKISNGLVFKKVPSGTGNLKNVVDAFDKIEDVKLMDQVLDALSGGDLYINTVDKTGALHLKTNKKETEAARWHFERYKETYTTMRSDLEVIMSLATGKNKLKKIVVSNFTGTSVGAAFSDLEYTKASRQIKIGSSTLDPTVLSDEALRLRLPTMSHNIHLLAENIRAGKVNYSLSGGKITFSGKATTDLAGNYYEKDGNEHHI